MAVMGVLKKCADCGTVFVAENPASKYCPCCSASPARLVGMDTASRPRMP